MLYLWIFSIVFPFKTNFLKELSFSKHWIILKRVSQQIIGPLKAHSLHLWTILVKAVLLKFWLGWTSASSKTSLLSGLIVIRFIEPKLLFYAPFPRYFLFFMKIYPSQLEFFHSSYVIMWPWYMVLHCNCYILLLDVMRMLWVYQPNWDS